jgi:hypothetical protein
MLKLITKTTKICQNFNVTLQSIQNKPFSDTDNTKRYKELINTLSPEWRKIEIDNSIKYIIHKQRHYKKLEEELLPSQRKFVESVAHKVVGLNFQQLKYFMTKISEADKNITRIAPITYEPSWPKPEEYKEFPKEPVLKDKEEAFKQIAEWYKKHLPNFGIGGGQQAQAKAEDAAAGKKEEKKEEKKEVNFFDILERNI